MGCDRCELSAGTVVVYGAPYRHPATAILMRLQGGGQPSCELRHLERYFYFGYDTQVTYLVLRVKGQEQVFFPVRGFNQHAQVWYEDFGTISLATLGSGNPLGPDAKRLVVVAGCHRLATGIAARFLEDRSLQEGFLKAPLSSLDSIVVVFRVLARGSQWYRAKQDAALVEHFDILYCSLRGNRSRGSCSCHARRNPTAAGRQSSS